MRQEKCPNCGAPLTVNSDGSLPGCEYCGAGVANRIDPLALAAKLGADAHDVSKFVESLAVTLESAFPQHAKVERSGFFTKHVSGVVIEAKLHVYHIHLESGKVNARRSKHVRGIKLKDEELAIHQWLEHLSHELTELATENHEAARALQKFVR